MIEPNPYQVIRAKLYAEVYAAWAKAWAENSALNGIGGAEIHALRALADFDKAIPHTLQSPFTLETPDEHVHMWSGTAPDAFCVGCHAERYPTENPPDA